MNTFSAICIQNLDPKIYCLNRMTYCRHEVQSTCTPPAKQVGTSLEGPVIKCSNKG